MKKKTFLSLLALVSFLALWCAPAFAVPYLQLDIVDIEGNSIGSYDTETETIIAPSDDFILRALLSPSPRDEVDLSETFYISAAVVPQVEEPATLGSFSFSGTTINVTGDMFYGAPPLENGLDGTRWDHGDLSKHGIFETYFTEFGFTFDETMTTSTYNTQETALGIIEDENDDGPGRTSYYADFLVDTSGLDDGIVIHFDLYNTKLWEVAHGSNPAGDIDRDDFCPFSHDAQSNHIPDPAAVFLLGSACLIGLGGIRGKFHM